MGRRGQRGGGRPAPGAGRVEHVTRRLERLLRSPGPPALAVLTAEVDALGAAAISALAEATPWTVAGAR